MTNNAYLRQRWAVRYRGGEATKAAQLCKQATDRNTRKLRCTSRKARTVLTLTLLSVPLTLQLPGSTLTNMMSQFLWAPNVSTTFTHSATCAGGLVGGLPFVRFTN